MKRFIIALLSLCLVVSLPSYGSGKKDSNSSPKSTTSTKKDKVDAISRAAPLIPKSGTQKSGAGTIALPLAVGTTTTVASAGTLIGGVLLAAVTVQGDQIKHSTDADNDENAKPNTSTDKQVKKLSPQEILQETNSSDVHEPKSQIIKDNKKDLGKNGIGNNPDIGVDKSGNVVLIDRNTGKTYNTVVPLKYYGK